MRLDWRSSRTRFFLIMGFALVLRMALFIGYANVDPWDDTIYLDMAHRALETALPQGDLTGTETLLPVLPGVNFAARRGTYLPIAASQALLGATEWASSIPSLLASLGTLLFIYLIGCRLVGEEAALWGSLAFAFAPLDLVYSTRILGETLLTLWVTASVWSALEAALGTGGLGRRLFLYVSSGMCLFIAYWTRLSGLLGVPIVVAAVLPAIRDRKTRWEPLTVVGTFASALLVEGLHNLFLNRSYDWAFEIERGNSLAMFHILPEAVFHPFSWLSVHSSFEEGVPNHFFKLFLGTVDHYGGLELFSSYALLGALALGLALYRRRLHVLVFWVLLVFLFYQYGFQSLTWDGNLHYYLVAHRPRYLHLLLPALCLLLGFLLYQAYSRRRIVAGCLLCALILPSTYQSIRNYEFYRGSLEDLRAASKFLESASPATIYSDPWGIAQLRFLSRNKLPHLEVIKSDVPPEQGSWIVLGGSRGYDLSSQAVSELLPSFFADIHLGYNRKPPNWDTFLHRAGPHHVARQTDLYIFRVSCSPPL